MTIEIFRDVKPMREQVRRWRAAEGRSVGVVPTMGFLHQGHASLIKRSVAENDRTVVTIFVNPTQFGPGEDLADYPRDFARDVELCQSLGAGAIFSPEPAAMYPDGYAVRVEVPALAGQLCGRTRPVHFQGVCGVVLKLLHITEPDRAYFGLKDAQQFVIVSRMAKDLDLDVELVPCPIVREPDGLAMSSRNSYLSPEERRAAPALSRSLGLALELWERGERSAEALLAAVREALAAEPLISLEYAEAVDLGRLQPVEIIDGPTLLALAARLGRTRLIDNIVFEAGDWSRR
jgi:pantoate--beta-alanine ligase